MASPHLEFDVIVVGGGAAGLSGATTLARSRRSVLVVDAGDPRNAPASGVHLFLSRDGVPPLELLAAGRADLESYGATVIGHRAETARLVDGGFAVVLDDGSTRTARRLLVTTGLVDVLPDIDGLREHWGRSAVHCPYCHGWEVRDQAMVVLASGPMASHQAMLFAQLSDDVTLLLHDQPDPSAEDMSRLAAAGVRVCSGRASRVLSDATGITGVQVEDGVLPCTVVVVGPRMVARSSVLEGLGAKTEDLTVGDTVLATFVSSDPGTGMTSIPGVYVAGNVADPQAQVITAAASAVRAAAMINLDLINEQASSSPGGADQPGGGVSRPGSGPGR